MNKNRQKHNNNNNDDNDTPHYIYQANGRLVVIENFAGGIIGAAMGSALGTDISYTNFN